MWIHGGNVLVPNFHQRLNDPIDYPSSVPQVTGSMVPVTGYLSWEALRIPPAPRRASTSPSAASWVRAAAASPSLRPRTTSSAQKGRENRPRSALPRRRAELGRREWCHRKKQVQVETSACSVPTWQSWPLRRGRKSTFGVVS